MESNIVLDLISYPDGLRHMFATVRWEFYDLCGIMLTCKLFHNLARDNVVTIAEHEHDWTPNFSAYVQFKSLKHMLVCPIYDSSITPMKLLSCVAETEENMLPELAKNIDFNNLHYLRIYTVGTNIEYSNGFLCIRVMDEDEAAVVKFWLDTLNLDLVTKLETNKYVDEIIGDVKSMNNLTHIDMKCNSNDMSVYNDRTIFPQLHSISMFIYYAFASVEMPRITILELHADVHINTDIVSNLRKSFPNAIFVFIVDKMSII